MKKNNLKKSLALSVLMAFVITGSVYAESVNVSAGERKDDRPAINVRSGEIFSNAGTVVASESITVNNGLFKNSGTIETGILDIYGNASDQSQILGKITAKEKIIYSGIGGNNFWRSLSAQLTTPELSVIGGNVQTGLEILNNNVLRNVKKIVIESQNIRTGLTIGCTGAITIEAPIYLKGGKDARIEVVSEETFTAKRIISLGGKTKVQLNNSSSATLNNIEVQDGGDFSLQTWTEKYSLFDPNKPNTATFTLNEITVGDNAVFKTCIYEDIDKNKQPLGTIDCTAAKIAGDNVTINLGKNSKADFGGVGDGSKSDWRGDLIDFQVENLTINVSSAGEYNHASIEEYKQDYQNGVYIHVNDKIYPDGKIDCSGITVIGAEATNTGNLVADLQKLAYVVKITKEKDGLEGAELPEILAPVGANIEQKPGGIDDGGKGTVDEDGKVTDVEVTKNPDVYGAEEIGALGLLSWRTELSDMNKRLGELRDSKGEHGVWVRMVRGENDYKSLNSQYNIYQLGYDEKLSVNPNWTLGAAFSYTDGKGGYDTGNFDMDHKTLTLYGSKLNNDGSYIDIVGKYSRLNHDLMNTWGDGEYDANGYSIGVEVGKRFTQDNGFWIEPQAQLTYGHVGSANYRAGDIEVAQDGMESLIGRAGVRIGKDLNNGNVYLRASYLYDFDGETNVSFTNAKGRTRSFEQDLGGGWCEVGLGTNINLSDVTHLYFDIEKTFGGDVATDWKWNAGMRWDF